MVDTRTGHDGLFPDADPRPRVATPKERRRRSMVEWIVVVVGSVLVALLIKTFVVQAFYIPTGSMEPTLLGEQRSDGTLGTGDRVIVDKVSYRLYYEEILKRLRPGGLIVFDNVLWMGQVVKADDQSKDTVALRELNELVAADRRVECVMIGVADGLLLARKRAADERS